MDEAAWKRLERVQQLAKQDPAWLELNNRYKQQRMDFLKEIYRDRTNEFLLDFVNTVADMAYQELLLACQHMIFPEENKQGAE